MPPRTALSQASLSTTVPRPRLRPHWRPQHRTPYMTTAESSTITTCSKLSPKTAHCSRRRTNIPSTITLRFFRTRRRPCRPHPLPLRSSLQRHIQHLGDRFVQTLLLYVMCDVDVYDVYDDDDVCCCLLFVICLFVCLFAGLLFLVSFFLFLSRCCCCCRCCYCVSVCE